MALAIALNVMAQVKFQFRLAKQIVASVVVPPIVLFAKAKAKFNVNCYRRRVFILNRRRTIQWT